MDNVFLKDGWRVYSNTFSLEGKFEQLEHQSSFVTFKLESPSFHNGEPIPERFSCDGLGISPPLRWSDVPEETKSLVLVVEDPDVPFGLTITHWILYNIPPEISQLIEGAEAGAQWQGMSQSKRLRGGYGYMPPCPPGRKPHRYYFRLFALREKLAVAPGASRREIMRAMGGRIIASAELMGTYARKGRTATQ